MMSVRPTLLKKNDLVQVLSGRDKGKRGKLLRVVSETSRAYVEKVHLVKRHSRAQPNAPQGGIIEKEASIHLSNLMYVCESCAKPSRIGVKLDKNGKQRICKKCNKALK